MANRTQRIGVHYYGVTDEDKLLVKATSEQRPH